MPVDEAAFEALQQQMQRLVASNAGNRIEGARMPKIPPFIQTDPELWFLQVEATFRNSQITVDSTKVDYLCQSLGAEAMSAIRDILKKDPAPADIYTQVKERLMATFASSDEHNLRRLLKGQVLTDGKPSRILQRLRALNQGSCDDKIIQSVFLDQLPSQHRAILASSTYADLDKLAEAADKIDEISSGVDSQINAVSSNQSISATLEALLKRFDRLERKVDASSKKSAGGQDSSNGSTGSQSRGRSRRSRSTSRDSSGLCLAHRKYPNNPLSCREWCSKYAEWQAKNPQSKN